MWVEATEYSLVLKANEASTCKSGLPDNFLNVVENADIPGQEESGPLVEQRLSGGYGASVFEYAERTDF